MNAKYVTKATPNIGIKGCVTMLSQDAKGHNKGPHQQHTMGDLSYSWFTPSNNCLDAVFFLPFDVLRNMLNMFVDSNNH